MFKSVAQDSSLTERAQQQIEEMIVKGTFQSGDRLPPERELTEQLGVSKTVVREAIRSLAGKGLVEVRAGSGMYVRSVNSDLMIEPIKLLLRANALQPEQIHEARTMLEIHIAGLAAERAQGSDIAAMEETLQTLSRPKLTAMEFAKTDVKFHNCLAAAVGNPLVSVILNSLNDVMIQLRLRTYQQDGARVAMDRAVAFHARILERVKARDTEGARQAMQEHLVEALHTLRRVIGPANR